MTDSPVSVRREGNVAVVTLDDGKVNVFSLAMARRLQTCFDELAGITAFLISPPARNITGHTIDVDGGWTVQ